MHCSWQVSADLHLDLRTVFESLSPSFCESYKFPFDFCRDSWFLDSHVKVPKRDHGHFSLVKDARVLLLFACLFFVFNQWHNY